MCKYCSRAACCTCDRDGADDGICSQPGGSVGCEEIFKVLFSADSKCQLIGDCLAPQLAAGALDEDAIAWVLRGTLGALSYLHAQVDYTPLLE